MALSSDNNGMVMPVSPMYGGGYGNSGFGGFGGFGGDGWWLILLLLCGWGNGGFGGFGGWGGMMGMGMEFPWILNGQNMINANTNSGFDHAATQAALGNLQTSVTSGFGDMQTALCSGFGNVQNALCSGFAGTTAAVTGAQNAISQQLNTNELASLNRSFAEQTANMQGFNGVQAGIADLRYTEATENCATRTASAQNTRDIIDSQTRGTQAILDKLCALELDNVKAQLAAAQRENVGLQNQVNMATMRESQTAQTAQILAGQTAEVDSLYNRLSTCPVPTTPVYGRTPIFTCNNNGCGCGTTTGFVG